MHGQERQQQQFPTEGNTRHSEKEHTEPIEDIEHSAPEHDPWLIKLTTNNVLVLGVIIVFLLLIVEVAVIFIGSRPLISIITVLAIGFILLIGVASVGIWSIVVHRTTKSVQEQQAESIRLREERFQLLEDVARLQQALESQSQRASQPMQPEQQFASPLARTSNSAGGNTGSIPAVSKVVEQPVPQKLPTIYDKSLDPPDFEQDRLQHPHVKLYSSKAGAEMLAYDWQIIAASRRGYGHAYYADYREDDFAIRTLTPAYAHPLSITFLAIADGLSATKKKTSRYGALAAVEGAVTLPPNVVEKLETFFHQLKQNPGSEACEKIAYWLLKQSLLSARSKLTEEAKRKGLDMDDLHSTLIVALIVPLSPQRLFTASVQVGDGALFALCDVPEIQLSGRWSYLQAPQIQEAGNEVQPFSRSYEDSWQKEFQCGILDQASFVMGMTDGTLDDIEPPRAVPGAEPRDPFHYVDDFYQHIKRSVLTKEDPAQALCDFLGYKKVQSHDDRTVVCLYRSAEAPKGGK